MTDRLYLSKSSVQIIRVGPHPCPKELEVSGPGEFNLLRLQCSLEVAVAPERTACVLLHFLLACLLVYLEAAQESAYVASAAPPAHMAQLCISLYFSSEHSNGTLLQYGSVRFRI